MTRQELRGLSNAGSRRLLLLSFQPISSRHPCGAWLLSLFARPAAAPAL